LGTQPGPFIYDTFGNLVWSGYGVGGAANAHAFHVCEYQGLINHLCYIDGNQQTGYVRGTGMIMDASYRVVQSVKSGMGRSPNDQHEFNVMPGGETVLITIYEPLQYDLSAYGITSGQGWLLQGIAQEVNIATGQVIWEWKSIDHVPTTESYVAPGSIDVSGDGLTRATAWDYFHMNAIDKDVDGNYLISSRHTSTIFNVFPNGTINWRMNGYSNSLSNYTLTNFNFSSQHHIRYLASNDTTMTVSLFDNASNGYNVTSSESKGKLIVLNNDVVPKTATLVASYAAPDPLLSRSQGDMQTLANGNVFVGWGANPYVTEYNAQGEAVLHGTFGTAAVPSYRAYKMSFQAAPVDIPVAYSYSYPAASNETSTTRVYMSWNGCTTCHLWNVYTAPSPTGPWSRSPATFDPAKKAGFETLVVTEGRIDYVIVESLDINGVKLANSTVVETFVPGDDIDGCTALGCPIANGYAFQPKAFGDPYRKLFSQNETNDVIIRVRGDLEGKEEEFERTEEVVDRSAGGERQSRRATKMRERAAW
jgi:hypothetical protein